MIRYIFAGFVILHGLIHLLGFLKAFALANIRQLSIDISKPLGLFWLLTSVLSLGVAVLLLTYKEWSWLGMATVLLSQMLIIFSWHNARFGTFVNIIILLSALLMLGNWQFKNAYETDVTMGLKRTHAVEESLLTENDLKSLPEPVQKYLRYVGVLNKPKVYSSKIIFDGAMRDRGKDWFPFHSEQYNFFDVPTRLFFMEGKMFGVNVPGYHAYKNGTATMQIKLFGIFPIVNARGLELDKAETVTIFNDMCILAPATLIDKRIQWQAIDSLSAVASFTCQGITIHATLYFNDLGQLTNFTSNDRYAIADMKQYRFSTPLSDYKTINGYNLATYGEAVWHYPEGNFTYGKFHLKSVSYNKNIEMN